MPSITLYTSESHRLTRDDCALFSAALAELAQDILKARPDNIHISCLTAEIGFGTPVYFEARLRQEMHRTKDRMAEFMYQVDQLIREMTGVSARIRCFSFEANNIYGKN